MGTMFRVWAWDPLQSLKGLALKREGLLKKSPDDTLMMKLLNLIYCPPHEILQISHFRSPIQLFWYTTVHNTQWLEWIPDTECCMYGHILNTYWCCYCTAMYICVLTCCTPMICPAPSEISPLHTLGWRNIPEPSASGIFLKLPHCSTEWECSGSFLNWASGRSTRFTCSTR
jgi:hypothetical protein